MRPLPALVPFVLAAACGGGGGVGEERPAAPAATPRPGGLELAVSRVAGGNPPRRDVTIVDAAGRELRRLDLPHAGYYGGMAWSPDGRRIAYTRVLQQGWEPRRTQSDVFVANADGSGVRRLTDTGRALGPVWAPNGNAIVFSELVQRDAFPPSAGLWSMAPDGGGRRELVAAGPGRVDLASSFAPDGSRLAFTRWMLAEGGPGTDAIHVLELSSLEERELADDSADAAYSPDGGKIAFASDRDRNGELSYGDLTRHANELYVMDADGSDARRLTRTRDLNERAPSWSPDGELLAYQRGQVTGNAEGTIVLTARADGSCQRPVAFDPGLGVWYGTPTWRPGRATGTEHLRCRPAPERAQPAPVRLGGNFTLAQARRYRAMPLYWLGRRFDRFVLSSLERRVGRAPRGPGPVVHVGYGHLQLQLYHACVRVPRDIDLPVDGRLRLRGREAVLFEDGYRLELVTGTTTIVIFGRREQLPRVVRALRPLNPPVAGGGRELPPPAPGAVAGRLRCS